jgi:hypothetical protein
MTDRPATTYGYVDILRIEVDHHRQALLADARANRLAHAAARPRRRVLTTPLVHSYLTLWWAVRPRGRQLGRLLGSETAAVLPRPGGGA